MVVAILRLNEPMNVGGATERAGSRGGHAVTLACQCLRPGEEAALQVSEVWFDYDVRAGGRYKSGTLAT